MDYEVITIVGIVLGSLSGCICVSYLILYCQRLRIIEEKRTSQKSLSSQDVKQMRQNLYGVVETSNMIVDYTNRMPQRNRDLL